MKVKRNKMNRDIHKTGDLVTFDDTGAVGLIVRVDLRPGRFDGAFYSVLLPDGLHDKVGGYRLFAV